jgi:WD40 repeat protein
VTGYGVYRLNDSEQIVVTDSLYIAFSPDSRYVVTTRDGVFRLDDGQKLFDIFGGFPEFSPDNNYVYAWADGVYRLDSGEKLFDIPSSLSFSPDMNYAIASSDGVYQLSDGQKLYDLVGEIGGLPEYSKNGDFMWFPSDGILYRIDNGEILFESHNVVFSPDGNRVAIGADGVYQLSNQNREFSINGRAGNFSPDGSYLASSGDGIYRVEDGYRLIEIPLGATFSSDNMYIAGENLGVYHIPTQQKLFDIEGSSFRFSHDNQYLIAFDLTNTVIYRLSDGKSYSELWVHDVSNGILSSAGTVMVIED